MKYEYQSWEADQVAAVKDLPIQTVSLTAQTWEKIVRRLTAEVGADDESRRWARAITDQITRV